MFPFTQAQILLFCSFLSQAKSRSKSPTPGGGAIHVHLPGGHRAAVAVKGQGGQSVREALARLCDDRGLQLNSLEVVTEQGKVILDG